ncbi:hypothetical protein LDENG_00058520 [Lucifuga dentata]|nr:hypothetical protein LDENG_00058520 [Lucifuga dentata]
MDQKQFDLDSFRPIFHLLVAVTDSNLTDVSADPSTRHLQRSNPVLRAVLTSSNVFRAGCIGPLRRSGREKRCS